MFVALFYRNSLTSFIDTKNKLQKNTKTNNIISEFAKELGLDILARKRFVKGIIALRREMASSNGSNNISNTMSVMSALNSVSRNSGRRSNINTLVSKAEHQAISKLYVRFDESSRTMNDIHHSFGLLKESQSNEVKKIESSFVSLNNELEAKKNELLKTIDELKETKSKLLKKQLETLKVHRNNVTIV